MKKIFTFLMSLFGNKQITQSEAICTQTQTECFDHEPSILEEEAEKSHLEVEAREYNEKFWEEANEKFWEEITRENEKCWDKLLAEEDMKRDEEHRKELDEMLRWGENNLILDALWVDRDMSLGKLG